MSSRHDLVLEMVLNALRKLNHVDAILGYGSTATQTWSDNSDIDLIVITSNHAPIESLHLFIDDIPIDLSLRNREMWEAGESKWTPPDGLTALWDPDDLVAHYTTKKNNPDDAKHFRYAHRHMLLKVQRWQKQDPIIGEMLAANAVHWVIVSYFHARGMRFPGIDKAVSYFRMHDPEMLNSLLAANRDQDRRYEMLRKSCEIALEPIGGLWQDDEVFVSGWQGNPTEEDSKHAISMFQPVVDLGGNIPRRDPSTGK